MNNNSLGPWQQKRLGDDSLTDIKYGKANPKKEGNIPVIGSSGVYDSTDEPLVDAPSIIIGRKGNAGSIQLIKKPCWPSDTTFYLKLKSDILTYSFLSEYLTYRKLSSEKTQTTLPSLSIKDIIYVRIPIPPLVEQRGIVEVLRMVDECIRLTDAVIERAEELKQGLMQRLLTRGIGHTEYKETPLGKIPKIWNILNLGDTISNNIDYRGKTPPYTTSGIPCISAENVNDGRITHISKYISKDIYETWTTRGFPQPNDIIITTEAPVGEIALFPSDQTYLLTRRVMALQPNKKIILNHFLKNVLMSYYIQKQFAQKTRGTTVPRILKPDLFNTKLLVPPINEQKNISDILKKNEEKIIQEETIQKKLKILKQGLMHQLLSGKIRVELKGDELLRIRDGREAHN